MSAPGRGGRVRPSMPPATTTTWPVTWPERVSDARTTTCAATSSGCATLRSAIVRETARPARRRRARASSATRPARRDGVHARGGAMRAISFFSDRSRPPGSRTSPPRSRRARLAEDACRRADEDERAVPVRSTSRRNARATRKVAVRFAASSPPTARATAPRRAVVAWPDAVTAAQTSICPSASAPRRTAGRRPPRR